MSRVTMHNPQSGVTQRASQDAFERVWSPQGWVLVEEPAEDKSPRKKAEK